MGFSLQDSWRESQFFEKTFLLANTSMKIVFGITFVSLRNANMTFGAKKFIWRSYITTQVLFTAKKVELINKHEFVKVAQDRNPILFWFTLSLEELQNKLC